MNKDFSFAPDGEIYRNGEFFDKSKSQKDSIQEDEVIRKIFVISAVLWCFGFLPSALQAADLTFAWHGQACFTIETSQGVRIVTDPVNMGIHYNVPRPFEADIVTVSHEHGDHNQVDSLSGSPVVLRGLTGGGGRFAAIDRTIKGVRIFNVSTYHDESRGAELGLNAVFVIETDGLRIVHLGDLGHVLTKGQVEAIGTPVDVLMIPVGGRFTIAGKAADAVIDQLKPKRIVFPMHYQTEEALFLPYSGSEFCKDKESVSVLEGNSYILRTDAPSKGLEYILMSYK
jgi:L-ascorbate metabolism protein UlaG (beta-lactamase superfamily)